MDDLLSFALTESGLEEFFLSNSNDGFIEGQPAANGSSTAPPAAGEGGGGGAGAASTSSAPSSATVTPPAHAPPTIFPTPPQQQQQQIQSQPLPLPPEPKVIIVPRSAPPLLQQPSATSTTPVNPFGDLLATAAAALNDDVDDDDPLMMLSKAVATSSSSAPFHLAKPPKPAVAPSASAAATVRTPDSKAPPVDTGQAAAASTGSSRALGGAESALRPAVAPPDAEAAPSTPTASSQKRLPVASDGVVSGPSPLRPPAPQQQPLAGGRGATPVSRVSTPGRLSTPESQSRPGSTPSFSTSAQPSTATPGVVRRVFVGAGGQMSSSASSSKPGTPGPSTTVAAAAATTSTPSAGSVPVTPAPPGTVIKKKVLLKRTMKGPNGPHTTTTNAIMTINDKGEKQYHTIPSPGGSSQLITTVGAPGTASAAKTTSTVRQTTVQQAAADSLSPAGSNQQQQQEQAGGEVPSSSGGGGVGTPHVVVRRRPGEQPRRIVVVRQNGATPTHGGGATVGTPLVRRTIVGSASTGDLERMSVNGGGGGGGPMMRSTLGRGAVVRRVGEPILRPPSYRNLPSRVGGYVQRASNLIGNGPPMEHRYGQPASAAPRVQGGFQIVGAPSGGRLAGGRMQQQQSYPRSLQMPQQQQRMAGGASSTMMGGGGGGAGGGPMPRSPAPAANTASYTTYQRSAYPRGGLHSLHHQQQMHKQQQNQHHHLTANGHNNYVGRGGSTMASQRMARGGAYAPHGTMRPPPARQQPQQSQLQQLTPQNPQLMHLQSQQQSAVNMTAYSPMPRGLVGQDSGKNPLELDIRRRSMTPGLQSQSGLGGLNGIGAGGGGSGTLGRNGAGPMGSKSASSPALPKMAKTAKEEMQKAIQAAAARAQRHDIDEEEENLGHAETYAEYKPAKLRSGQAHPDSVVETASLSSVAPPDVKYQIHIPETLIDNGLISALQLEAVIYACQMHENLLPNGERLGYLIGDGAGVGKGRTVACIIFENYMLGRRRALWLSVSNDLRFDSERDLRDIGAGNIQVHSLNKMKYSKISGKENGMIKKGVMFATYSSLIGECRTAKRKYQSRLKQLIQWLGVDFDGCIVFDECHKAKNLVPSTGAKPTKTGQMVTELQRALPKARVVYASATGATEPRNMAYMTRLGLWGPGQAFKDFGEFINAVERRGVGAMEIVAMDMKQRGLYLARQLSFRGVNFNIQEVQLSDRFVGIYDESVKLWVEVRRQFQTALSQMDEEDRVTCKHIWGQFWASHQRFFKYLCIAAKVEACVKITREAIAADKCVVIGLQSTGESRTLEAIDDMDGELTDFVSTAKAVLTSLIDKQFPTAGDLTTDIFRDFDRMFGDGEKRKRRRPTRNDGMDVLEELGLGPSTSTGGGRGGRDRGGGPRAKRMKREDGSDGSNSTTSSSGDESEGDDDDDLDDEEDGMEDEEDDEDAEEFKLGERDEDWLKALLAEAASSSEEEDGDDDSDDEKKIKKEEPDEDGPSTSMQQRDQIEDDEEEGEEEFNPFACDFSRDDPWASKQQVVEDSPKKKRVDEDEEENKRLLEDRRRERRRLRRRKKRKMARKLEKIKAEKKQREIASEAVKNSASDFMTSSRLVEGDPETFNPQMVKAELLAAVERLGPNLPANTLDQLIDDLGGPEFVAEMTGRKGRIVQREDGEVEYELRHTGADVPLELMNMDEKDKFMKGEKVIAIISEAASSGISLQSDRRAPNHRRRVHITLELPWSADKAIQQFGRTHRSNQVTAPEYIFLISELAGEKRFASIVAKRLESLGALTHGDRRATESRDLSQFNFDTKYGRSALDALLRSVIGQIRPPIIPPPENYKPGNFFQDMCVYLEGVGVLSVPTGTDPSAPAAAFSIERDASTIAKFLNRILGLPVHAQNALFAYFADILAELIQQAKHDGTYDMGIMDLGTGGDQVRKLETRVFLGKREKGSFRVEMHKIGVERGVSWDDAFAISKEHNTGEDGFYVSTVGASKKKVAALVYGIGKKRLDSGARLFAVTRPSTGRLAKLETFAELTKRFEKATPEEAKAVWEEQWDGSNKQCQHAYVHGKCKNEASGIYCEVGRRTRTYFVLAGSVLSVWPVVEDVLSSGGRDRRANRMQVIRVRTESDQKIVGLLVLPQYVRTLISSLEEHCGRCFVDTSDNDKKK